MTIIVEDGSGVPNANSYASVDDLRAYAEARGHTFVEDRAEAALLSAMDYVESQSFVGTPVYATQWPRRHVVDRDGRRYADNMIPRAIVQAQMIGAVAEMAGTSLWPVVPANARGAIRERKVGPITTVYAVARDASSTPRVPLLDAYLAAFIPAAGVLTVVRA